MANTYKLITSTTLNSSAATVTIGSGGTIPQTYTDLKLVFSAAGTASQTRSDISISINGLSSSILFGTRAWGGDYGNYSSDSFNTNPYPANQNFLSIPAANTANTFGNIEMYYPNYTSSSGKCVQINYVLTSLSSSNYICGIANQFFNTSAAITSIVLGISSGSFKANSTFYLYGIKNS